MNNTFNFTLHSSDKKLYFNINFINQRNVRLLYAEILNPDKILFLIKFRKPVDMSIENFINKKFQVERLTFSCHLLNKFYRSLLLEIFPNKNILEITETSEQINEFFEYGDYIIGSLYLTVDEQIHKLDYFT